jgi:hypothetical protein
MPYRPTGIGAFGFSLNWGEAFRQFVDAAGPNARNFKGHSGWPGMDPYSTAVENLRALIGLHLAVIAGEYGIEIEPDLAQILPPDASADDDQSFLPGWDEPLLPARAAQILLDCHGRWGWAGQETEIVGAVSQTWGAFSCYGSPSAQGQRLDKAVDRAHRHRS